MAAANFNFAGIPGEDQRVEDDYIDELVRKYLYSEDMNSFYEHDNLPLLASPEADKWPGEVTFIPDFNYSQDCLVPELLLMENTHSLLEKYDGVEPQEELLSILEEIITEDEKKSEGISKSATKVSYTESIAKPDKITSSDSKPVSQETQSDTTRPKRTSTDKKGKRRCRSQPIIMKRRTKQRIIEE